MRASTFWSSGNQSFGKDENRMMQGVARSLFSVVAQHSFSLLTLAWSIKLNLTNFGFSLQYPGTMQRYSNDWFSGCQRAQTMRGSLRRYG